MSKLNPHRDSISVDTSLCVINLSNSEFVGYLSDDVSRPPAETGTDARIFFPCYSASLYSAPLYLRICGQLLVVKLPLRSSYNKTCLPLLLAKPSPNTPAAIVAGSLFTVCNSLTYSLTSNNPGIFFQAKSTMSRSSWMVRTLRYLF